MPTHCVLLVVLEQIAVQGAQQDHGHHGREEDGDENRVDEGEPLHVGLRHGAQDVVPAAGPADALILLKFHSEGVGNCQLFVFPERLPDVLGVNDHGLGVRPTLQVVAAGQLDLSPHDAAIRGGVPRALVVGDDEVDVIEEVRCPLGLQPVLQRGTRRTHHEQCTQRAANSQRGSRRRASGRTQ